MHREFAQLAVVEDGLTRDEGRIGVTPQALRRWALGLCGDDEVALEATGNSDAIANLLIPLVGRVVVSNPSKTRAIAEAKVKTDKVDARILAQLLAADLLPSVWLPDWKPVFYALEDHLEVWLLNAGHMKAVPGRKSDVRDAEWIAQLLEHGLVRASFVPPPPIRRVRNLTRYRVQLMGDRTRDATRLEKLLEDVSIKISVVASSVTTVSARAMLAALGRR